MDKGDILTTKRLVLRPLRLDDAPEIQRIFPYYETVKYMSAVPWPYPADGAEVFIKNIALPGMKDGTHWLWAITVKDDDTLKGMVHLRRFEKMNRGFWLAQEHHGKGIMTEAVLAVNDYAFGVLDFDKIRTSHAVPNIGSRRIKEKTGSRHVGMWEEKFIAGVLPSEIWELTKEDWQAWKSKS